MACSIPKNSRAQRIREIQTRYPDKYFFETSDYLIDGGYLITPRSTIQDWSNSGLYRLDQSLIQGGPSTFVEPVLPICAKLNLVTVELQSFNLETEDFLTAVRWTWILYPMVDYTLHDLIRQDKSAKDIKLNLISQTLKDLDSEGISHNNLATNKIGFIGDQCVILNWLDGTMTESANNLAAFQQLLANYHLNDNLKPGPVGLTNEQKLAQLRRRYPGSRFEAIRDRVFRNCGEDFITSLVPTGGLSTYRWTDNYFVKGEILGDYFRAEINDNLALQNSGLIPPVVDVIVCESFELAPYIINYLAPQPYGWLINRAMDGTVVELMNANPPIEVVAGYASQMRNLLERLHHEYRMTHEDFKFGNVVYQRTDGGVRLYLIDLDGSDEYEGGQSNDISQLYSSLADYGYIYDYANDKLTKNN